MSKTFTSGGSSVVALDDVSFDVEAGEFVALLGPSGCGKSTLLRMVDGLSAPTAGEIEVSGVRVTAPGSDRAFVFQGDALLPWRTVGANARLGLDIRGVKRRTSNDRVDEYLAKVGLTEFKDRYPHELSGGMRQRLNLIRALVVEPQVLLMDEPFTALDSLTREQMQAELIRLWTATRKTVLFVTHSIEEAVFLADRVVVMSARPGRIVQEVAIALPRPRDISIQRTAEFADIAAGLWRMLRDSMMRSDPAAPDAAVAHDEIDGG